MKRAVWMLLLGLMACQNDATPRTSGESHWQIGVTNVDVSQLARAFARVESCGVPGSTREYFETVMEGEFMRGARAEQLGQQVRCAADAADCDAALTCLGWERSDCVDAEFEAQCDGSVVVRCVADGVTERKDCADDPEGNTRCNSGFCGVPAGLCEARPDAVMCDGDVIVDCASGALTDCGQRGGTCRETPEEVRCVVAEDGCEPCDGTIAQACEGDVVIDRGECAAIGLVCVADEGGNGRCVAEAPECENNTSRCAGDTVQHCVVGVWHDFDCAEVDAACAEQDFDGLTLAACER